MFKFPKGLYTDVRIEKTASATASYLLGKLDEIKEREIEGAFIRVFDGERWYYSSTTDLDHVQKHIDRLAKFAKPKKDIDKIPVVEKFPVNTGIHLNFKKKDISKISLNKKSAMLKAYFPFMKREHIKYWRVYYIDSYIEKRFCSSKGADIVHDFQKGGFCFIFQMARNERLLTEKYQASSHDFEDLRGHEVRLEHYLKKCEEFFKNAVPVKPGKYRVIMSPDASGVFAHESFGHKSEADFMLGDEAMKKEWTIGKKVSSSILSIIDDGTLNYSGYAAFDDEGVKTGKTFLIKNGILTGRLHSCETAAELEEEPTGNARAISYEFEPIVRMTNTYIAAGKLSKAALFSKVKDGIFVETIKHGSGMSTFTIAPSISYEVKNGKIGKPLLISVVTGDVFKTLSLIESVSKKMEMMSFVMGGCGKMEQYPLNVGIGGPFVLIKELNVQ